MNVLLACQTDRVTVPRAGNSFLAFEKSISALSPVAKMVVIGRNGISCTRTSGSLMRKKAKRELGIATIILHNHAALSAAEPESALHWSDARQATGRTGRTNEGHRACYQADDRPTAVHRPGRSSEKPIDISFPMRQA